jgi:hypothetical protein
MLPGIKRLSVSEASQNPEGKRRSMVKLALNRMGSDTGVMSTVAHSLSRMVRPRDAREDLRDEIKRHSMTASVTANAAPIKSHHGKRHSHIQKMKERLATLAMSRTLSAEEEEEMKHQDTVVGFMAKCRRCCKKIINCLLCRPAPAAVVPVVVRLDTLSSQPSTWSKNLESKGMKVKAGDDDEDSECKSEESQASSIAAIANRDSQNNQSKEESSFYGVAVSDPANKNNGSFLVSGMSTESLA